MYNITKNTTIDSLGLPIRQWASARSGQFIMWTSGYEYAGEYTLEEAELLAGGTNARNAYEIKIVKSMRHHIEQL